MKSYRSLDGKTRQGGEGPRVAEELSIASSAGLGQEKNQVLQQIIGGHRVWLMEEMMGRERRWSVSSQSSRERDSSRNNSSGSVGWDWTAQKGIEGGQGWRNGSTQISVSLCIAMVSLPTYTPRIWKDSKVPMTSGALEWDLQGREAAQALISHQSMRYIFFRSYLELRVEYIICRAGVRAHKRTGHKTMAYSEDPEISPDEAPRHATLQQMVHKRIEEAIRKGDIPPRLQKDPLTTGDGFLVAPSLLPIEETRADHDMLQRMGEALTRIEEAIRLNHDAALVAKIPTFSEAATVEEYITKYNEEMGRIEASLLRRAQSYAQLQKEFRRGLRMGFEGAFVASIVLVFMMTLLGIAFAHAWMR